MEWNGVTTIELLQLTIEAIPNGILLIDGRGSIALVNHETERQFGYSRVELIGHPLERLLPAAPALMHSAPSADSARRSPPASVEPTTRTFGVRNDGTRFSLELRLKPVRTDEYTGVLVTIGGGIPPAELGGRITDIPEPLAFARLTSEISCEFINLSDRDRQAVIEQALGRVCAHVGLDVATFCRFPAGGRGQESFGWGPPDRAPDFCPPDRTRFPWGWERVLAGQLLSISSVDDLPIGIDRNSFRSAGLRSALIVPLTVDGHVAGGLCFAASRAERHWTPEDIRRLRQIGSVFDHLLARQQREDALRSALADVRSLREALQARSVTVRTARKAAAPRHDMGTSLSARRTMELIQQVAATSSTVLLLGETGTGKELFASQIHELGARRHRSMVRVNCAAIPSTLIESELFGREKGAFTGALARQVGRFELADKATIFLDEIGDLPFDVQVKLLRVLEEGQIERLGSPQSIHIDTRIIAATHQDLQQRMAKGMFREDLFYRLNVFPIRIPPLRERVEDIPHLIWQFVEEFSRTFGKRIESISRENLTALQQYSWPGNIRELRNIVERAMILAQGPRLTIAVPSTSSTSARRSLKLVDVEEQHLRAVLESSHWRIRGEDGAAARLGLKPTTLETRMARLGLKRPNRR